MTDSRETLQVVGRAANEAIRSYRKADLPLAIKVATPVTGLGVAVFGLKGAGIVAFGGAVGLPVVVLLFLGVAGVTSILEAFVRDKRISSPHAQLALALIALEGTRRYRKSFLTALQRSATTPKRADTPEDQAALLPVLRKMHPTDFERHVLSFFTGDGRHVGVTPQSNDYGVDGFVTEPDGSLTVVQCKRHSAENRVGRPTVQQFKGVIEEQGAKVGYLVTTSEFTVEAQESAAKSDKIVLVDCDRLIEWHRGRGRP
ncbi:MAG: restriction endonuclease [Planctomycetota bacterium]